MFRLNFYDVRRKSMRAELTETEQNLITELLACWDSTQSISNMLIIPTFSISRPISGSKNYRSDALSCHISLSTYIYQGFFYKCLLLRSGVVSNLVKYSSSSG